MGLAPEDKVIRLTMMLHDVAKCVELEGKIVFKYSLEGKLLGHIHMMAAEIHETADRLDIHSEKALLLEHLVLSHHGQLEFGSPILPLTKEALMLETTQQAKMTQL